MPLEPFNPFRSEVIANPYPYYRRYREEEPVHFSEVLDAWVLTRYEDVDAVLVDHQRFSANRRLTRNRFSQYFMAQQEQIGLLARTLTMLGADPPEHTRLRRLVSKAFTAKAIDALAPRIEELAHSLLDEAEAKARKDGAFDLVALVAYPLPVVVIAEMIGVPPEDREMFKRWSDDVALGLSPFLTPAQREQVNSSVSEMAMYFADAIRERRLHLREDLISTLVAAREEGQALSDDEVIATLILLLVAGNETTTNFLGGAVLSLLQHPDQLDLLRQQPELMDLAVEELLRWESPAQTTARVALEDVEIGEKEIKAYQLVFAVLAAANRDPEVFPDPERLDITRSPNPHLAFGDGIHFCLGAPLARLESRIALKALLDRFPRLRLAEEKPLWRPTYPLRGLQRLMVAP